MSSVSIAGLVNEAEVGLPPLSPHRRAVYAYYQLRFLPDGYPGRVVDGVPTEHPIYATYVIHDYLSQYHKSKDVRVLDGAKKVADAAIARMSSYRDSLVFWYTPDIRIADGGGRFYSALTSARYLEAFGRLFKMSGEAKYLEAADAIFRGLRILVGDGGVLRAHPAGGVVMEEYVYDTPDYILNGWTTALLLVIEYQQISGSTEVAEFIEQNVTALRNVMPLYDLPELANSRYRLSGKASIRLAFSAAGVRINSTDVVIPGYGEYRVSNAPKGKWQSRYRSGLDPSGKLTVGSITVEAILSMLSVPERNKLVVDVDISKTCLLRASIGEGDYNPLKTALNVERWSEFRMLKLEPGNHRLELDIPWIHADLVAYPTNFLKRIGGKNHNQYHFIHVTNMRKLYEFTGDAIFQFYAERWSDYPRRWPQMPPYADADLALDQFNQNDA